MATLYIPEKFGPDYLPELVAELVRFLTNLWRRRGRTGMILLKREFGMEGGLHFHIYFDWSLSGKERAFLQRMCLRAINRNTNRWTPYSYAAVPEGDEEALLKLANYGGKEAKKGRFNVLKPPPGWEGIDSTFWRVIGFRKKMKLSKKAAMNGGAPWAYCDGGGGPILEGEMKEGEEISAIPYGCMAGEGKPLPDMRQCVNALEEGNPLGSPQNGFPNCGNVSTIEPLELRQCVDALEVWDAMWTGDMPSDCAQPPDTDALLPEVVGLVAEMEEAPSPEAGLAAFERMLAGMEDEPPPKVALSPELERMIDEAEEVAGEGAEAGEVAASLPELVVEPPYGFCRTCYCRDGTLKDCSFDHVCPICGKNPEICCPF